MVDQPVKHFEAIAEAGGDSVTFHSEVAADVDALAAGLAATPSASGSRSSRRPSRKRQPGWPAPSTSSSA